MVLALVAHKLQKFSPVTPHPQGMQLCESHRPILLHPGAMRKTGMFCGLNTAISNFLAAASSLVSGKDAEAWGGGGVA